MYIVKYVNVENWASYLFHNQLNLLIKRRNSLINQIMLYYCIMEKILSNTNIFLQFLFPQYKKNWCLKRKINLLWTHLLFCHLSIIYLFLE